MDALRFLDTVKSSKEYKGQIAHVELIGRRSAVYSEVEPPVSGETAAALRRMGIDRFYSHQAESIEAVRRGENIVVVTATASGKTLCYNVPVIESLELDRRSRALYIYPTKALAQDQLGKLKQYGMESIKAATYDGDTPRQERPFIKSTANIVLTNPDMLHVGILPYHSTWSDLFRNLKYIVIDEVHMYRGVFGAHVANVIRRLRRIAEYYGSHPQFVCASATVNDPGRLVKDLTGVDARVIDSDGSPSGRKVFAFWNPPHLAGKGERRSANSEAVSLFTRMVESDVRSIVFTKARKTAELILRYARTALHDEKSPNADKIIAYRAGYRPADRREIERKLFDGELIGVTSTTALEVGVDIGGLDAVVMTGYPGTVASTWQQAGRAGRGVQESLAVLIALDNPIDQYMMRNPDYFFSSEHERAIIDSQNPYILADHLLCAAYEIPIDKNEVERIFGERAWEILGMLGDFGQLEFRKRWFWTGSTYPAADVNIRSAAGGSYSIVSVEGGGAMLGTVDGASVFDTVHPGAVYLHSGESYVVTKLDVIAKAAYVEKSEVYYYTTPGDHTRVSVEAEAESRDLIPVPEAIGSESTTDDRRASTKIKFGDVIVGNRVTHFWRKQLFSDEVLDKIPLDLPETVLHTEAVWITVPDELVGELQERGFDLGGSIHAVEHAAIGLLPLFALCDRQDIGGVSHPNHPDTEDKAAIFIYDGHAGGVGLARTAYDRIEELLTATLVNILECPCEDGCPSCIQSPKCGNNNEPLDKEGAAFLLRSMLG
ncbi:MAG: DEAD/DEAH box helicase [Armatimonadota bacterium]|nr:DEAD/DEAH box helicase [bacterium]